MSWSGYIALHVKLARAMQGPFKALARTLAFHPHQQGGNYLVMDGWICSGVITADRGLSGGGKPSFSCAMPAPMGNVTTVCVSKLSS